ncbi:hypothetical protein E1B28_009635 [Marasmius oreades]|uniref:Cyclin-domain-containing protein n=1 Tax=Marasmius oreades TaxID=181124 RepID=A0A9P7URW7_9AGAR|nr:uncharacterized protein E1B28_009635 [Marasmius oreades]KAG7090526.1 hypothetical protein E1B28_009635 [Marasmius oreades]
MNPLPTELLSSWSLHCRSPRSPLTPPLSSTFHLRKMPIQTTFLPPISYLDKHISDRHVTGLLPLTPPDDVPPPHYSPSPPPNRLPPIASYNEEMVVDEEVADAKTRQLFFDAGVAMDWLDFSRTRSAHFIAEKTCEMICYLWFSSPLSSPSSSTMSRSPTPKTHCSPTDVFDQPNSTASLQFSLNPIFVQFTQKLLETTQVSQSVIVLSLHYIYRLKERNRFTTAASGSEFRIAVAGLMMANKFLDDNTYTNKTWSEVSGIDLNEVNRMEREFLIGVDFNLYVDKATYESWLNLLKGLVMAKERDTRNWRRSSHRGARVRQPGGHITNTPHRYSTASSRYRPHHVPHRARSTSPTRNLPMPVSVPVTTSAVPPRYSAVPPPVPPFTTIQQPSPPIHAPVPRSGIKRTAEAAFSPTSATFSDIPAKRVPICLQIPETSVAGPHSYSPIDVQSFADMSIDSPDVQRPLSNVTSSSPNKSRGPETLATAYALDEQRRNTVPRNLYFYALACSPMDPLEADRRKARLRYHQPPPPSAVTYAYPTPRSAAPSVNVIHSASTSPNDMHLTVSVSRPTLPHFHETAWTRPQLTFQQQQHHQYQHHSHLQSQTSLPPPRYTHHNHHHHHHTPPTHLQQQHRLPPLQTPVHMQSQPSPLLTPRESPVQSAPFANAGPPGVHVNHSASYTSAAYVYPTPRAWYRRSAC